MKRILSLTMSVVLMALVASSVMARPVTEGPDRLQVKVAEPMTTPPTLAARADTVFAFAASGLGSWGQAGTTDRGYNFDGAGVGEPAGWTGEDMTAQTGPHTRWHLASTVINAGTGTDMTPAGQPWTVGDAFNDFALWCGLFEVCGWINPTGYGNDWEGSVEAAVTGAEFGTQLTVNWAYNCDFEGDVWDYFEMLLKVDDTWELIYDNHISGETTYQNLTFTISKSSYPGALAFGPVRFRFHSDGAWSDADGLFPTNVGAVWIDNIELRNGGVGGPVIRHSDFETGVVPAWVTFVDQAGAGDWAELYEGLYNQDPCSINNTFAWAFFDVDTTEPGNPLPVIAYGEDGVTPYVKTMTKSPILDMTHSLGDGDGDPLALTPETQILAFYWVYVDLPADAVLYYNVEAAAQVEGQPCLNSWADDGYVIYGDTQIWSVGYEDITQYVLDSAGGSTVTGLALHAGCWDMCAYWCDQPGHGDGLPHTSGPFFDNIEISLVNTSSIAWEYDIARRLQDNFPATPGGTVRIDPAINVEPTASPTVVRGDSLMIELNADGDGGILHTFNTAAGENRPELILWFQVVDGPHAGLLNATMADQNNTDGCFSPWDGILLDPQGEQWGTMVADTSAYQGTPQPNKWAFDFNDAYFLPGDIIYYYFRVETVGGTIDMLPEYAQTNVDDPYLRDASRFVVRCLPVSGNHMLFVEDSNNLRFWWREGFRYNGYTQYDHFFCQANSSGLENGLSGMTNIAGLAGYNWIIWDSGPLKDYSVTSASGGNKSDDAGLLRDFMVNQTRSTYLWMMGDQIANELTNGEAFFVETLGCNLLDNDSYGDNTGVFVPRVNATHPLLQYAGQTPYYWVYGGCPVPRDFAMVAAQGGLAVASHQWVPPSGTAVAGIYNTDPDGNNNSNNSAGNPNRTLFMPYSYAFVRDAGFLLASHLDYARLMVKEVLNNMMNNANDSPPDAAPPVAFVTRLDGNFPNPFNPQTKVKFSLASAEHVTLAVYDISGRMVTTLINEPMTAGSHSADWNGTDFAGQKVASGVYFAKMNAGDYSATERMVMLK